MHTSDHSARRVHDRAPDYGTPPSEADRFPAERALRDLPRRPDAEAPLIVARYAALRSVLLRGTGAPADVLRHAQSAAVEHVATLPPDHAGTAPLEALLDPAAPGSEPWVRLTAVMASAEEAGHAFGAETAGRLAVALARRAMRFSPAAAAARQLAALLRRQGADGRADRWDRRAAHLERIDARWVPPSAS